MVSIIIPYYNSERFLRQTLDSVRAQSWQDWECILVDDGSTDRSPEIAEEYAAMDVRFRRILRTRWPKGVSSARNTGLDVARGTYVIFLDADDLMAPHCLGERVTFLDTRPDLDFAVFQMETFGDTQSLITHPKKDYLKTFLKFEFIWTVSSPIWKSEFLNRLGGFDTELTRFEDPDLSVRAMVEGGQYRVLTDREPDIFYRQWKSVRKLPSEAKMNMLNQYRLIFDRFFDYATRSGNRVRLLRRIVFEYLSLTRWDGRAEVRQHRSLMLQTARQRGVTNALQGSFLYAIDRVARLLPTGILYRLAVEKMMAALMPLRYIALYVEAIWNRIR